MESQGGTPAPGNPLPIEVRVHSTQGAAVAVLHGGPGAPRSVTGLARELSRAFAVVEPLQRWSGGEPLTVARHVADLRQVAPAPVALVGWSWGAMLALSYSARFPDRVNALVLVGCGTSTSRVAAPTGDRWTSDSAMPDAIA